MYNSLGEIRIEREARLSALFKEVGLFFAFSNQQFEENRTPVAEGEKYASVGGGGYLPSSGKKKFGDGLDSITEWYNAAVDEMGLGDEEILYELHNHECPYTGEIEAVVEMFQGRYDRDRIARVFYTKCFTE